MKPFLLLLIACCLLNSRSVQAQPASNYELTEIYKLAETYKHAPHLSYNLTYTLADSTAPGTALETITGSAKVSQGKYWTMMDSVEFIQGQQYSLTIHHRDSVISVADRLDYGTLI